jgi:hypothetical protein
MRSALLSFVLLLCALAHAQEAQPPGFRHQAFLSVYFHARDGSLDWTYAEATPTPAELAADFWTLIDVLVAHGGALVTLPLPVHPDVAPIQLRFLDGDTRTMVCETALPLMPAARTMLDALGCVERTDEENQQLFDAAKKALELHNLTLTPSLKG